MPDLLLLLWMATASAIEPQGWRGDGSGHAEAAAPPVTWTESWSVPLQGWSNASPVPMGPLVCTNAEPTELVCLTATTGQVAWRASHPVLEALGDEERDKAKALIAQTAGMEEELGGLQRAVSELQRHARRSTADEGVVAALQQARDRLDLVSDTLDSVRWLRTPRDQEIMGYSTSTPVTDGERIWALYGKGVVACHSAGGTLLWQRWLGPSVGRMRGYDKGHAASPALAGGRLIVPWGELRALNPDTGETVWSDGRPWRDYAPPAVIGEPEALVTPDGRLLDAATGRLLQEGLGDIYYVGPYAAKGQVFFVGGHESDHTSRVGWIEARAWRWRDGELTEQWRKRVDTREVFYAAPVLWEGLLYSVDKSGVLRVFDASTGEVVHTDDLLPRLRGWTFPSPTMAGGRLWIGSGKGTVLSLLPGRKPEIVGELSLGADTRATPLFLGDAIYARTLVGVVRLTGP